MAFIIAFAIIIFIIITLFVFRMSLWGSKRKLKEAMRLEAAGKYFEAISIYDFLLNEGHHVPELRWKIANISLKVNNIARAQKELAILLQTGNLPENVTMLEVRKLMADSYLKLGKMQEAFLDYLAVAKLDPENPEVLFELAKIYAGQGLPGKAVRLFEKCLKLNPNDYEITYYLARAYLDFGDAEKATEFLEKTAKLRFFDNGRVNYYLGILYFSQKKYNLAIQHFSQVIKLRQNDNRLLSEAHHYIALCYKERGLVDEAVTNFEKSQIYSELLPKDFQNIKSLYNQGVLLYKSGQYQKALEIFYKVKMIDYRYKDVDKIIKEISLKLKTGAKIQENIINYINENPLVNILKRGLLLSKTRFNINAIESKSNYIFKNIAEDSYQTKNNVNSSTTSHSSILISDFNNIASKSFKDIARKLVNVIGFQIKSEPKFFQDEEYIDGNAINFYGVPIKNPKVKKDVLITIRRFKDAVPELSVSRFIDWMEEKNIDQGIYIASNSFSPQALKVISTYPKVKFIDKVGLSQILGRIK
jgi:tetratricopeptide (TPR) repeat protein